LLRRDHPWLDQLLHDKNDDGNDEGCCRERHDEAIHLAPNQPTKRSVYVHGSRMRRLSDLTMRTEEGAIWRAEPPKVPTDRSRQKRQGRGICCLMLSVVTLRTTSNRCIHLIPEIRGYNVHRPSRLSTAIETRVMAPINAHVSCAIFVDLC
jgi:hypothetical protein